MFLVAVARHCRRARTYSLLPRDRSESCSEGNTQATKTLNYGGRPAPSERRRPSRIRSV